jgi:hypothetical protein
MPQSIQGYLLAANDPDMPPVSKPSLQQYDNYQIYDLYCVDITIDKTNYDGSHQQVLQLQTSFLAVQAYSYSPIKCDFNAIVEQYK